MGQSQDFGTVPKNWECPRSPGQSFGITTVPETWSPNTMGFISQSQETRKLGTVPTLLNYPRSPGQSQNTGRVPGHWDCSKDTESQHNGGYFSISRDPKA